MRKQQFPALTPVQNRRLNSVVNILDKTGEIEDAAFLHSILCQTFLPYRNPGQGIREYQKKDGNAVLLLKAGELFDPKKEEFKKFDLPYGPKARLMLAYINTVAIKTQNPTVEVANSLTGFVRRLGLDTGGRTIKAVKEQINRLAVSTIRVGWTVDGDIGKMKKLDIISEMETWLTKDESQRVMWPGTLTLDKDFYESLMEHAIPLDERALGSLANNALALDIYVWLSQRLHRINPQKPVNIGWEALEEQFSGGYSNTRKFRQNFRKTLKENVLPIYPKAKVDASSASSLVIHNSPAPILPERRFYLPNQ